MRKLNLHKKLFSVLASALLGASLGAAAQEPAGETSLFPELRPAETRAAMRPSIGLRGGVASIQEGYDEAFAYGLEAAYQPYIPLSVGAVLSRYGAEEAENELVRTNLLAQAAYNFGGNIPVIRHSFLGVGAGAVWDEVNGDVSTKFGIAPELGFDIPLARRNANYTLGAVANYLILPNDDPESVTVNGTLKYWF